MQRKCKRAQSQACLNYAECSLSSNDSAKVLQISETAKNRPAEFCYTPLTFAPFSVNKNKSIS